MTIALKCLKQRDRGKTATWFDDRDVLKDVHFCKAESKGWQKEVLRSISSGRDAPTCTVPVRESRRTALTDALLPPFCELLPTMRSELNEGCNCVHAKLDIRVSSVQAAEHHV